MPDRTAKIASLMQRTLAEVLQRQVSDPRVQGLVSITRVEVPPDLRVAQVYVSVLPEEKQHLTLKGLRSAAPHLHHKVKKKLALRVVPHLDFRLDDAIKKESAVFDAIAEGLHRAADTEAGSEPRSDGEPDHPDHTTPTPTD